MPILRIFLIFLLDDYVLLHIRAWTVYKSTCEQLFLDDPINLLLEKYDNIFELEWTSSIQISLYLLDHSINPNEFPQEFIKVIN